MFKRYNSLVIFLLALSNYVDIAQCSSPEISWYYRGTAQQNNSVLTFNMGDTLNLVCKAYIDVLGDSFWMYITKGQGSSTGFDVTEVSNTYELTISDAGTLIYDDFEGVQPGFENFVIVPGTYLGAVASGNEYRYIGVALLKPEDAGTYHCNGIPVYYDSYCVYFDWNSEDIYTSGALTLVVNTKVGQAHSPIAKSSPALTYSALILSASKLLF